METSSDKKTLIHKTPQEIVHIKHTISARQYKYWILLLKAYKELWEADVEQDKEGFYTISMSDISDLMGYELVKKELKSDLEALRQQPIIINYLEKDKRPVTHGMGFISEWKVTSNQIAFKIPSFLEKVVKGDLEAQQMFLLLNWDIFNSFNGKYEAIIYKLCKDYIGVGKTPYMSIEKYRDYIGLKDNEYKATDNLTRRCITNPIENINNSEISDIFVEVVFDRQGRKVLGLHFKMRFKPHIQQIAQIEINPAFKKSLITFTPTKQKEYLEKYTVEQIQAIIDYVNENHKQGKIKNLSAYYSKAFDNSWGLENFEAEQKEKAEAEERKRQEKAKREAELKAKKEQEEKERKENERIEKAIKIFESLPKEEQKRIIDELKKLIKTPIKKYFSDNYDNGKKPYTMPPFSFSLRDLIEAKYSQE